MSRMIVFHIACGGKATDDDTLYPEQALPFLTDESFTMTCFTCLDEISDRSELRLIELNVQ